MKTIEFKQLDETLYYEKLDNGLDVYILPKKGFSKTFVTFTTKYGSVDRTFVPIGETESITVPDGIAHFLEHKMFEKEDGDVFKNLANMVLRRMPLRRSHAQLIYFHLLTIYIRAQKLY